MPERGSVTAVMPTYNAASTVLRAVQSVLEQTRPPERLVVVDDGSSDDTLKVLRQALGGALPTHVDLIALERNAGPSVARNTGWDAARTEFVAFLDADDAWHPQKLERQLRLMNEHPFVAMSGHLGQVRGHFAAVSGLPRTSWVSYRQELLSNRFSTPTVMLRTGLSQRFEPNKSHSEDYLLWLEIIAEHGPALLMHESLFAMFKARAGESGLSGNHLMMGRGEMNTYLRLTKSGRLHVLALPFFVILSAAKTVRRVMLPIQYDR